MQMTTEWTLKAQNSQLQPPLYLENLDKYLSAHLTSQTGELMVLMVGAFSASVGAAVAPAAPGTTMKKKKVQVVLFSELIFTINFIYFQFFLFISIKFFK